jgi:hypothetical protein
VWVAFKNTKLSALPKKEERMQVMQKEEWQEERKQKTNKE